ncbi:hypothetical protein GGR57DRAFT_499888 [Xylariaceae sp. FL1272]|nr:hypothetical protein GGR57DRAFT_499888 [Xylariaceae sp. FL1272]
MADHELPEHYSPEPNKEAVLGYYHPHPHPAGLEVAPNQTKPTYAFNCSERDPEDTPARPILGLRRPTFFLSLALIVVILAAAIGAGVGGSVAANNAKKSCTTNAASLSSPMSIVTTTATVTIEAGATSTATAGRLVVPTGVVALDCPSLSGTSETIKLGSKSWVFDLTCGTDFAGGDIGAVIVYSLNDCLQACAAHNFFSGDDSCQHVTFNANQTFEVPKDYGNCWLKTGDVGSQQKKTDLICGAAISSFPQ